jgi:hypothetical protein
MLLKIDNKRLGIRMQQWNSSKVDPIYKVGSLLYAGLPIEKDEILACIGRLRDLVDMLDRDRDDAVHKVEDLLEDTIEVFHDAMELI